MIEGYQGPVPSVLCEHYRFVTFAGCVESCSLASAGNHGWKAVKECAVGVLRPVSRSLWEACRSFGARPSQLKGCFGEVLSKTEEEQRLESRGAPQGINALVAQQ